MKELNINWETKEVKHNGIDINLSSVKIKIKQLAPQLVDHYRFSPKFNSRTGEITYKYAWDSIFFDFHKSFGLKNIFDILLKESGYGTRK